jgi:Ca2+-binding EF-hand superfamily protein
MSTSHTAFLSALAVMLLSTGPDTFASVLAQDAAGEVTTDAEQAAVPQAVVGDTDSIWTYLVQKYDTNADQRITRDEYTRDDATFARLDRDGDGAVTAEETVNASRRGGGSPSMMTAMVVMRAFGERTGGMPSGLTRAQLESGATAMDSNADLVITREEFDALAGRGGGRMRMPDMDRFGMLLESVDTDGSETISRQELLAWFDTADSDKDGQLSMQRPGGGGRGGDRGGVNGRERGPRAVPTTEPQAGVGRTAPDFTLQLLHDGAPVTLSSFVGNTPVALIFGSYT